MKAMIGLVIQNALDRLSWDSLILRYQIIVDKNNPNVVQNLIQIRPYVSIANRAISLKFSNVHMTRSNNHDGRKSIDRRIYSSVIEHDINQNPELQIYDALLADNHSNIIEGTKTNVFGLVGNILFTPDLSHSGVSGVMREEIFTIAKEHGLKILKLDMQQKDILQADVLFVTNAVIGLQSVTSVFDHKSQRTKYALNTESIAHENLLKLQLSVAKIFA